MSRPETLTQTWPSTFARPDADDHVTILMATFNGARWLDAQLDSFLAQTHPRWSLLVSDDGSSDGTVARLRAFQAAHPARRITILLGPRRGSAQNFLSLLRAAGRASLVAFADQDDVWLPDKLARAVAALDGLAGPALYGSRTLIADQALGRCRMSPMLRRPPCFGNALVQNIAGGNTMMLNRAALDVLQPASLAASRIIAHDWWCYQAVSGIGGQVLFDHRPSLLYRQHGGNLIGANDGLRAMWRRMKRLGNGEFATWLDGHADALASMRQALTPEARQQLNALCAARMASGLRGANALRGAGILRQRRRGNAALWMAALVGWL